MGNNEKAILVVDDEKNIRELVKFNLESRGFKVIEAADGEEALNLVKTMAPDLIILDLMLPKLMVWKCRILKVILLPRSFPSLCLRLWEMRSTKMLALRWEQMII